MDKLVDTPINLSELNGDLVLHVPMPGAEPENIKIRFDSSDQVTVVSTPRGKRSDPAKWYTHEWRIGDYQRLVHLPYPVDSKRVNVTYNNGVLTVTMPRGERTTAREVGLGTVGSAHGQEIGHRGQQANVPR